MNTTSVVFDCLKLDNQTKEGITFFIMIYQYDASNEVCPLPLVKLRVMLKKMGTGDKCHFFIKDNGSKSDIPKLLTKLNHQFVARDIAGDIQELIITIR